MSLPDNGQQAAVNAAVIAALFRELDALGVREFCVCAGARNAAIIEALTRRAASGGADAIRLHRFVDERSAGFFALGRAMQTREPAAVLTTSGTAAAELLPAVIEAHYQHLPLVAVTADRPARYEGSGAPQAIEQRGLFGVYAPCREVGGDFAPSGEITGPLHLNVRLEEGLARPGAEGTFAARALPRTRPAVAGDRARAFFESPGSLVVLAAGLHPSEVPAAVAALRALQAPVVAEATSQLQGVAELRHLLVRGGERALASLDAKRVLRLGAVPSWRWWRDLDGRDEVPVLNVSRAPFRGLARTANVTTMSWEDFAVTGGMSGTPWSGAAELEGRLDRALEAHPLSEPAWMRRVSRMIGGEARVLLGNSLVIREWNLAAAPPAPGAAFFANRGANGIDGLISTWLGVSADAAEAWCVLGDLSAVYDMNAPWLLEQLPPAKRRIVIVNNGGGKIFSQVAWLGPLSDAARAAMENPHALSFEPWARMWGLGYRLLGGPGELRDDSAAPEVWEIRPDPDDTAAFWRAWRS